MAKKKAKARARSAVNALKLIDKRMYGVFLALVVLVPLAFSRTPFEWFVPGLEGLTFDQFDITKLLTMRFLTAAVLGFWILKLFRAKTARIRYTPLDFVILVFLAFVAVSTVLSIHFPTSLHGKFKRYEGLLTFINYGLLYFLALQTFYSTGRIRTLGKAVAATGGIVALYGVAQFAGLDIFRWAELPFEQRRSFATFGNPDLLAGYLVLAFPFALGAFLEAEDPRDKLVFGGASALIAINIITTLVRGAWIAAFLLSVLFFGLIMAGFLTKRLTKETFKRAAIMLGVFVVIFAGMTAASTTLGQKELNIVERVKSMTRITEGSAGSRFEIWKAGFSMIKERPVFGMGPDTFRLASERYETEAYVKEGKGKTVSDNAHNYVVQLAAGPGTLAAIAFFVFVIGLLAVGIKAVFTQPKERFVLVAAFVSAGAGYLIHLLFGVSVVGSTGLFWVALGALAGMTFFVRDREISMESAANKAIVGMVALVMVISAGYAGRMFVADYYYGAGYMAAANNDESAVPNYERAISLYTNGRYMDSLGMYYLYAYASTKNPSALDKSIEWLERSIAFEPLEADHQVFLANALIVNPTPDNLKKARRVLERLAETRPLSVQAMLFMGEVSRQEEDYAEAERLFKRMLEFDPRNENAHLGLGQLYVDTGRRDDALKVYKKLVGFAPDNKQAVEAIKRIQ
ncbi:MAG: O-antigen ligase family protein [Candidatus Aquicultorales bacterium]